MNLNLVNVASIGWAIQFRLFDQPCRRRGTTNYLIHSLPVGQSWSSYIQWKAMDYQSHDKLRPCKCGQYWLNNSISTFWSMIQEEVQLIAWFVHFLCANLKILTFIGKVYITSLRMNLDLVNVASIGWIIQFRLFDQWCRRRGTTTHLIVSLPLAQYWCSWMRWKAISYPFYDELRPCKCGQYWLSNSISTFWSMMQKEGYN